MQLLLRGIAKSHPSSKEQNLNSIRKSTKGIQQNKRPTRSFYCFVATLIQDRDKVVRATSQTNNRAAIKLETVPIWEEFLIKRVTSNWLLAYRFVSSRFALFSIYQPVNIARSRPNRTLDLNKQKKREKKLIRKFRIWFKILPENLTRNTKKVCGRSSRGRRRREKRSFPFLLWHSKTNTSLRSVAS